MIYVSQGHEEGIGLEVFLKSILFLNEELLEKITLCCSRKTLEKNIAPFKNGFKIDSTFLLFSQKKLKLKFIESVNTSLSSLEYCIDQNPKILITLPTSKDKFNGDLGYTEYFRRKFKRPNLAMNFLSPLHNVMLLSDHQPINSVSTFYHEKVIVEKITNSIGSYKKFGRNIERIFLCGLNPHSGEGGLIGRDELALNKLKVTFTNLVGPISADSLFLSHKISDNDLLVFAHHDQALVYFKLINQFLGLHFTSGLPFARLSVDHGTGFDLVGKDKGNFSGMLYVFKWAEKFLHSSTQV